MGKKDASANRGTPVEQYRKDIGITYTLFLICFCRDMSIIIVIEFVYKYPTIPGIRMLLVRSIAEFLNVPVLFDMKSKSPTS